ncbi:IS21 family transposase [Pseudoalteromonas luteoviolacea]|uniref:Integrase catalytic domain-containing protein n=1 Tax=Pseudoalteromonas luteoviolacea S4060-1 TaxID=1365257 RepID=A0A167JBG7_9GAMM|nr:IS21 family transposase [Pseudoalteromonas luteoviolacea]KZN60864.1 hypothetical protein N478_26010 [Pseudoalteromonas luteoviolacea S4060-1]
MMLSCSKIREITRVCELLPDCTQREGASLASCSHQSFGKVRHVVEHHNLTFDEVESLEDSALQRLFYPKIITRKERNKRLPNKERIIETRVKRKGKRRVTWVKLYVEYQEMDPESAYGLTQFTKLGKQILQEYTASMKQFYLPGEALFIDYAGLNVFYREGNKWIKLYVFVAVLGYSKKIFAIATRGMTTGDWLYALRKALEHFGGVPEVIHFDNAKSMVSSAGLLPKLSERVLNFFRHYQTLADTSRVGMSKDNGLGENAVKILTYGVLNLMQDLQFSSLSAVNEHLHRELIILNARKFQSRDYSRDELFIKEEKEKLKTLPQTTFRDLVYFGLVTVTNTYLVGYNNQLYSVPSRFIGQQVELRVYDNKALEIWLDHKCVAQHQLVDEEEGVVILSEHMPPAHRKDAEKTKSSFMKWAKCKGKAVEDVIERQYQLTSNNRSRHIGKRCVVLQKYCEKVGDENFVLACEYALKVGNIYPSFIESVTRAQPWLNDAKGTELKHSKSNVRGPDYYKDESDEKQ